jgi:hypothetical protein
MTRWAVIAICLPICASAQMELTGPVAGYVLEARTAAIRPILGMAGSAVLGAPVDIGYRVRHFSYDGKQGGAIIADTGEAVVLSGLGTSAPQARAVTEAISADGALVSADCRHMLLYSATPPAIQYVRGLPDAIEALEPVRPTDEGIVTAASISGDGSLGLVAIRREDSTLVYVVRPDGYRTLAADLGPVQVSAMEFVTATRAVIAVEDGNRVFELADLQGAPVLLDLVAGAPEIDAPVALRALGTGALLVANRTGNTISFVDLAARIVTRTIAAGPDLSRLSVLGSRGTFLLNGPSDGPLYILQTEGVEAVTFVPPAPMEAGR